MSETFEQEALPYLDLVYGAGLRMTRNRPDAEYLVAETFARASASFRQIEPGTSIKAWLFRFMFSTYTHSYQKKLPRRSIGPEEIEDWGLTGAVSQISGRLKSTGEIALERPPAPGTQQAAGPLPEDLLITVYLADVEGFSYQEIAYIIGMPIGTVMSRLHRGRGQLRDMRQDDAAGRGMGRPSPADTSEVPSRGSDLLAVPCSEVLDRLYAYLDGELADADAAVIRQHLEECGPCLREYGLEEAVKRVVKRQTESSAAPADLRAKVLVRIRQVDNAPGVVHAGLFHGDHHQEHSSAAAGDHHAMPGHQGHGSSDHTHEEAAAGHQRSAFWERVYSGAGQAVSTGPARHPGGGRAGDDQTTQLAVPGSPAARESGPARHLVADLPERAPTGRRISLLVWITLVRPATGASAPLRQLDVPSTGCHITITVSAPDLIPLGDLEQDLRVSAAGDSDPIRFGFGTGRAGLHTVMVRAFANGTFLGELALQVSVEAGAGLEQGSNRMVALAGLAAEPGEVTLQVSRTDDDRYSFQLIGEALYPVELTKRLAGDPAEVVCALVSELRAMAGGTSPFATTALARNRIKNLGAQLWADAVPEAIRRQFWLQADRIKLFTVASDMDTVPWELLYPVDGDNDNGFLVEQFPVVRRVYGQGRVRQLPLASAAYIVPPGSPGNAMEEVHAIQARLGADIRDQGIVDRLNSLIALLESAPSVLHFACHNQFSEQNGSAITLAGGPLRPGDLAVAVQKRSLATANPLVFFNACRTAGEIPGFMQMMGWAKQFMGAGAGAFLGSLWAVRSGSARAFADAFYKALVTDRAPLGAAALQARKEIAGDDGDPTWLAYTVYGNPSATVEDAGGHLQPSA